MKDALDAFLSSIPGSSAVLAKHTDAVALFGFFLSEIVDQPITPGAIIECYGAAHLRAPRNVSDTMSRSGAFVRSRTGWGLQREAMARLKALVPTVIPAASNASDAERRRTVMVVYGRDEATRVDMFNVLRSLNLKPVEWNEAVIRTGKSSPYVGEILTAAFDMAQAFLVLMTPDEQVVLRAELRKDARESEGALQPRPNVILEGRHGAGEGRNADYPRVYGCHARNVRFGRQAHNQVEQQRRASKRSGSATEGCRMPAED